MQTKHKYNELIEQDDQLFFMNDYAQCYEIQGIYDRDTQTYNNNDNSLRVYKSSPDGFTLQIRTFKPINEGQNGKPRNMIAHLSIGINDLRKILAYAEARTLTKKEA